MVTALVTPHMIKWARERAGVDVNQAAHMMKVDEHVIVAWELGEASPSMTKATELAKRYRVPLAALYMEQPPIDEPLPKDHRTIMGAGPELGPEARYQIRWARARRRTALDLLDSAPPAFELTASLTEDPVVVASRFRQLLQVSIRQQFSWADRTDALRHWRRAVERLGVLVFQTPQHPFGVRPEEMRGFSSYHSTFPLIGLVGMDTVSGRIFTIMHELTHLATHTSGVCDWSDNDDIEVFCNAVAGSLLVPSGALRREFADHSALGETPLEEAVAKCADRFQVSRVVLARRLLTLDMITKSAYQFLQSTYAREFEAQKSLRSSAGFARSAHQLSLSNNGDRYSSIVVEAYRSGRISARDAAAFADMPRSGLDSLEQAVLRRSMQES